MSKFNIDIEEQERKFARSMLQDLEDGLVTLFAVTCVGNPEKGDHASHGGYIVESGAEAIKLASNMNRQAPDDHCWYMPTCLGVEAEYVVNLANELMLPGGGPRELE